MENIDECCIVEFNYSKIVNLIKTFYLQGFEDAANCPEPVDMSEDIKKQLDIILFEPDQNEEWEKLYCSECEHPVSLHKPDCLK